MKIECLQASIERNNLIKSNLYKTKIFCMCNEQEMPADFFQSIVDLLAELFNNNTLS